MQVGAPASGETDAQKVPSGRKSGSVGSAGPAAPDSEKSDVNAFCEMHIFCFFVLACPRAQEACQAPSLACWLRRRRLVSRPHRWCRRNALICHQPRALPSPSSAPPPPCSASRPLHLLLDCLASAHQCGKLTLPILLLTGDFGGLMAANADGLRRQALT